MQCSSERQHALRLSHACSETPWQPRAPVPASVRCLLNVSHFLLAYGAIFSLASPHFILVCVRERSPLDRQTDRSCLVEASNCRRGSIDCWVPMTSQWADETKICSDISSSFSCVTVGKGLKPPQESGKQDQLVLVTTPFSTSGHSG